MRIFIYNILVNRHVGIQNRYHDMHDNATGVKKVFSWIYLLCLNIGYYIFFLRFLGDMPLPKIYENKNLLTKESESEHFLRLYPQINTDKMVDKIKEYDVVSFDVFDTLIYRPFFDPVDVFYIIGERLHYLDFRAVRMEVESKARQKRYKKKKDMEVTFDEIWDLMEKETGIPKEKGMKAELEAELEFCYANPFMREVWDRVKECGKTIVITSDMYLPAGFIDQILEQNGFTGADKLFVSNEYRKNKGKGELYDVLKADFTGKRIIHIGDNAASDWKKAQKKKLDIYPYMSSNYIGGISRAFDLSYIIGSAYRALVCQHLYSGLTSYSMEYEYGYIYGGLFVTGYCHFIHDYCQKHEIDRILFLSRDGETLKLVYDMLYPGEDTKYVYSSRKSMTKLMADHDRRDFFRRFIYHKVNQKYKMIGIFRSMGLEALLEDTGIRIRGHAYALDDMLSDKNADHVKEFIEKRWDAVLKIYRSQNDAGRKYYKKVLEGAHKAAAVDIGWTGSGALALSYLTEKVWQVPCSITGIVAGTNTLHLYDADSAEPFYQSGKLVSYMYSSRDNRDIYKLHNPSQGFAVYWEQLLSSPARQFDGFGDGRIEQKTSADHENVYDPLLNITYKFGKTDENIPGIMEIREGIVDFAREYMQHFASCSYMFSISGRDAYAPMVVAASNKASYLNAINKRFDIAINVD